MIVAVCRSVLCTAWARYVCERVCAASHPCAFTSPGEMDAHTRSACAAVASLCLEATSAFSLVGNPLAIFLILERHLSRGERVRGARGEEERRVSGARSVNVCMP